MRLPNVPQTYLGYTLVGAQHMLEFEANETLSPDVLVHDEFREDFNRWLLAFFGGTRPMVMIGDKVYTHPKNIKILAREEARREAKLK